MEIVKLIGVLIVIAGFILKLDTLAVVVTAGLATGLVAGMSPLEILDTLGTAFITNRTATLFILTLPVIGQSIPIAVLSLVAGVVYALLFDRILKRRFGDKRRKKEAN